MRKNGSPEDLSVEELRRLLVEKRRSARHERLDQFRRTGRVVTLVPDSDGASLESLRSSTLIEPSAESALPAPRQRVKRYVDRLSIVIELFAVIGLLVIALNWFLATRDLNQQSIEALTLPTMTPTPLIMAVVLPSGHTPPDSSEGARPNDAEIPEHLRPLVSSLASVAVPTPGPAQASRVQIPAIEVYASIVQGDGWEQLKKGVGQHIGTSNPGEDGNIVLTAHNDVFGELFRDLDRLQPGDEIIIYTSQNVYTYLVTGTEIVEPTQVEVMAPSENATVTLISCYPYLIDNKRIVVKGVLQSTNP